MITCGHRSRLRLHQQRSALIISKEAAYPALAGRIVAPGSLDPVPLSVHIQACDLMIQPYEQGISTRRTTAMACLSHGRAIVSNQGLVTETGFWDATGAIVAPPVGDRYAFLAAAEALLANSNERARLGAAAATLYHERFAVERAVATLLADAAGEPVGQEIS